MAPPGVRVLTANLLHDHVDAAAFGEILDRLSPDVVAAQELGAAAGKELARRYPHRLLRTASGSSGMGLALRHEGAVGELEVGGIPALHTRLHPEAWPKLDEPVELVSVHLANPVDWPPWTMARLRGRQVTCLEQHLEGAERALVVGDCNATPAWPAYRRIARFLDDGVTTWARTAGTRSRRTWGPVPGGPKLLRIDHAFVRGLEVTDARRVSIPGSDHAGVFVEVA